MRKLNSNIAYFLFVAAIMTLICVRGAYGQTACTASVPCVQVTITNTNTLPSSAILWACQGSGCTQAALNTVLAAQTSANLCPAVQSIWHCNQFSQTKTPVLYNDSEPWGSLMAYAAQGTSGGGVSANSPIVTFQMPAQPALVPSIGLPKVVTTGNSGPQ